MTTREAHKQHLNNVLAVLSDRNREKAAAYAHALKQAAALNYTLLLDKSTGLFHIVDLNQKTVVSPSPMDPFAAREWFANHAPSAEKEPVQ